MNALTFLIVFFVFLWLPLGQHEFLDAHWMKVGAFIAPILLFMQAQSSKSVSISPIQSPQFFAVLLIVAYLIHQIEEHWIDLFGNLYALHPELNRILITRFDLPSTAEPMTEHAIFFINTSLVWLPGFLAILRSQTTMFPMLAMAGLLATNGIAHLLQAVASGSYNPGLLTTFLLFFPLCWIVYKFVLQNDLAKSTYILLGVGWGALAHVILFLGLITSSIFHVIPESLYYAILIFWAVLPCLVLRDSPGLTKFSSS